MTWRNVLRWLKWTLVGLFLLVLSIITTLSTIVATEFGSRWLLSLAADHLPVEWGEIRGNLLTGLDLTYVAYRVEVDGELQQEYRAENVSFRWQPLALFYSAVSVQSLRAERLRVRLPPGAETPEAPPVQWPSFALPVRVELGQLQVDDIQVERLQRSLPPQPLVALRSVSGSLSLGTFNFRFTDLAVDAETYTLIATGRIGLRYPYDTRADLQWQYELTASESAPLLLSGHAQAQGDVTQLTIEHQLKSPLAVSSEIALLPHLSAPPAAIASLAAPQVIAVNRWSAQALPSQLFPPEAVVPVVTGELRIKGWIHAYEAVLSGEVHYGDLPGLAINAAGQGDLAGIALKEALLRLTEAPAKTRPPEVSVSGSVIWAPQVQWDLAVTTQEINPESYLASWPGSLTMAFNTRGQVGEPLQLAVENLQLNGTLRAFEVRAEGGFRFDGQVWQSDQLLLALGANHLRLRGTFSDQFAIDWYLDAPLLSQIDSNLAGSAYTEGYLHGSRRHPRLQLALRAEALKWQDYGVEQLLVALTPSADGHYELMLTARDLDLQAQQISEISLEGSGDLGRHQLRAGLKSPQWGEADLQLASGYQDEVWQGQITALELRNPQLPRWWLLSSTPMTLDAQTADLGELCLTTRSGAAIMQTALEENPEIAPPQVSAAEEETPALCLRARREATAGMTLDGEVTAVPLRQLRALLKPEVALTGIIEGVFAVQLPPDQPPQARLNLRTRDGELHYQYADHPLEIYRWQSAEITAELRQQGLKVSLNNHWGEYGDIRGDLALNTQTLQLDGQVHLHFRDLAPLSAFVPLADDLSGVLAADINLRGNLQQPQLLGQLSLSQGSAKIPRFGLDLQAVTLRVSSGGDGSIQLLGSAHSGEGQVQIRGDMQNFGAATWELQGNLQGEGFQIINQAQITALVSPDIQLTAKPGEMHLTGQALIPMARIDIKSLPPTATRVSDDVVIEEDGQGQGNNGQMALHMNVTAELGDKVTFSGFGLTSRLTGKMNLIKTPARPLLATGYVDVVDGKYRAYGQELTIKLGRLIFQGPMDNPGLDIRAERTLRGTTDHIVGLEIGGTLQRPTSSVYSDPPLQNEGEAMALLLTGKPLAEASAGDAYAIISAMSGLGGDGGSSITGQIADAFSLDELKISAEEGLEHSSLLVGKYLTPRLLVRYVVGLFDQVSKVGVSYQMTDRLRVEAESGEVQSVDVIYKIER